VDYILNIVSICHYILKNPRAPDRCCRFWGILYTNVVFRCSVWKEWVIDNNTFLAMAMPDGDSCGSTYRSTQVQKRIAHAYRRQHSTACGCFSRCQLMSTTSVQCESKKIPPTVFWNLFPNGWEFLFILLHTYYTIISTLDYKFLLNYLQLWQSYAILSMTTQQIFTFH